MNKPAKRYTIRAREQLRVLAAATRQEIVDVLAEMGTVSVAEIAATLGRPADALYFHLRALKRAGLVRQLGSRSHRGRKEALFRTVAPDLRLSYEPQSQANRRAVTKIVSSMLRLGIRDFGRAFERGKVIVSGPNRELWAVRRTGRLSLAQIAALNRSIEKLRHNVSTTQERGRLYGITILLTPLDHRARQAKRNTRPQRATKK